MRNIAVLVQEFGRAGRNDDASDGFLLVNKRKDDQRLIFWTKASSTDELEHQKKAMKQHGNGFTVYIQGSVLDSLC